MIRIGVSPITGDIYRGLVRVGKNGIAMWSGKKECITDECVVAVAESLAITNESLEFEFKGVKMVLRVEPVKEATDGHSL